MVMPGMGASAGQGSFPALPVVLALFMLGYIVWTTDRLTSLARAKTTATGAGSNPGHQPLPAVGAGGAASTPAATGTRHHDPAGRPMLAPKLAACGKIAMSITMGYMLILMF
jgi:hypothetical protein